MNTDAHGFCGLRASSILWQSIRYLVNPAEAQKGSVFVCFISVYPCSSVVQLHCSGLEADFKARGSVLGHHPKPSDVGNVRNGQLARLPDHGGTNAPLAAIPGERPAFSPSLPCVER